MSHDKRARTSDDGWPSELADGFRLIAGIQTSFASWLQSREHDPVRRERIADQIADKLLARAASDPPRRPRAWARAVARRLLGNTKQLPKRPLMRALDFEPSAPSPDPEEKRARASVREQWDAALARLRAHLDAVCRSVTPCQARAVRASLMHGSLRQASRAIGLDRRRLARDIARAGRVLRAKFPHFFQLDSDAVPPTEGQ